MKKYYLPVLLTLFLAGVSFAASKKLKGVDYKALKNSAHVEVELGEFFDLVKKSTAEIEIKLSMQNVYGFIPKSKRLSKNKIVTEIDNRFKNEYSTMVEFMDITCTYNLDKIEKKFHKENNKKISYLKIKYLARCEEPVKNHPIKIDFSAFNNIDYIRVELEAGANAKHFELEGNQGLVKY